jgi:serine/threonine-protein kinase
MMNRTGSSHEQQFAEESLRRWARGIRWVFSGEIPAHACWTDVTAHPQILNALSTKETNWMFLPPRGGTYLGGARMSHEPSCIELDTGFGPQILKPSNLTFESFGEAHLDWAYFRLEAAPLAPSGICKSPRENHEELTEVKPTEYVDGYVVNTGYWGLDETTMPAEVRIVNWHFGGVFLIVAQYSAYNSTYSTYDGRHNRMTAAGFRAYMKDEFARDVG